MSEGLRATQVAGYPAEWFAGRTARPSHGNQHLRRGAPTDTGRVEAIWERGSSSNGVFGVKLHLGQIIEAKRCLRAHLSDHTSRLDELLSRTFPQVSYVWLKRADKVDQAISLYRAVSTGEWARAAGEHVFEGSSKKLRYSAVAIYGNARMLAAEEKVWSGIFRTCNIEPLTVTYEALVSMYEPTIKSVLEYLRIDEPSAELLHPTLTRQADHVSAEWRARFRQEYPSLPDEPLEFFAPWVDALLF